MTDARLAWIRDAALLGARCTVATPEGAAVDPRAGWPAAVADWRRLAATAPKAPLEDWLRAALTAVERFPDVAAAVSILAEDERMSLLTPASFAQLAVAGLGADYDAALAVAMAGGDLGPHLDRVEPAGSVRPLSQQGLRLRPGAAELVFRTGTPLDTTDREPRPEVLAHPREARAAAAMLGTDRALWIRAASRRHGRQFALDVAGALGLDAVFLRPGPEDRPPPGLPKGATAIFDLFDADRLPVLPPREAPYLVIAQPSLEPPGLRAVTAPRLDAAAGAGLWEATSLAPAERARLTHGYALTLPEIRAALAEADILVRLDQPGPDHVPAGPPDAATVARAIRAGGARRMGGLVTLVETGVTLDDLVLAPEMRGQIDDAVAWRRNDRKVWAQMGLARDAAEARGLSLLFAGPPGGGKTFAARCLANALGLNLYRIDLSQVVSKYIGETEKQLARIFDEAEAGHGILFFDEADAIFGKRSEVRDAHDRYANIEVGFLLQRMEDFDGVMVLATNLRANLDPAFLRRIRFLVEFPMPARDERRMLWDRNLPADDRRDPELDIDLLADQFRLSGGNIRNVAVAAAHLAAAEDGRLGPRHLVRALMRELKKSGLPRGAKDFGPLARHLEVQG